jgi:hypothetical protein
METIWLGQPEPGQNRSQANLCARQRGSFWGHAARIKATLSACGKNTDSLCTKVPSSRKRNLRQLQELAPTFVIHERPLPFRTAVMALSRTSPKPYPESSGPSVHPLYSSSAAAGLVVGEKRYLSSSALRKIWTGLENIKLFSSTADKLSTGISGVRIMHEN